MEISYAYNQYSHLLISYKLDEKSSLMLELYKSISGKKITLSRACYDDDVYQALEKNKDTHRTKFHIIIIMKQHNYSCSNAGNCVCVGFLQVKTGTSRQSRYDN